jgi:hypothetical protein
MLYVYIYIYYIHYIYTIHIYIIYTVYIYRETIYIYVHYIIYKYIHTSYSIYIYIHTCVWLLRFSCQIHAPWNQRSNGLYIYISYISYYTWRERPTFFSPWLPQSLLPGLTRSSNPPGDNRAKYCGDQRIVKRLEHFKKAAIPKMPASYGRILMINAPCFFVSYIQVQLRIALVFMVDI